MIERRETDYLQSINLIRLQQKLPERERKESLSEGEKFQIMLDSKLGGLKRED